MTDGEFYSNYSLIGFRSIKTRKTISFELFDEDEYLSKEDAEFIDAFLRKQTTVGFYSNNFDIALYYAAISGYTCKELKKITNDSIVGEMRPWELADEWKFEIPRNLPHIDLIEVAFGQASLKIYNGRLHGRRMQDLPYDPDKSLTEDEKDKVFEYWKNDLDSTELLFSSLKNELTLRQDMSAEYRTDLMSKSDAQIAEAVMKAEIKKITGFEPAKATKISSSFHYDIPKYIDFRGHEQLESMLDFLHAYRFTANGLTGKVTLPEKLLAPIIIDGREYQMGIGGLHSKESCQHVREDNQYLLSDHDVESYYPRIIINQGLYPVHIGPAFLKVFERIVNRRINEKKMAGKLKKERDLHDKGSAEWEEINAKWIVHQKNSDGLKITINGLFGKLGNRYSIVFSPKLLIQVTLTGQLSLILLILMLTREGFEVVSANTDGIVIRTDRERVEERDAIIAEWERRTSFKTEQTNYAHLYSADVNNYIAIKPDGSVKTKGRFAIAEPGKPPLMSKNPTGEITVQAVIDHITKGIPLTKTIRECRDITKFVTVRTVQGGGVWANYNEQVQRLVKKGGTLDGIDSGYDVIGGMVSKGVYLGKALRFYYAKGLQTSIFYKKPNTKGNHNKVPKSDGAMQLMELPDEFPSDVDISRYVKEANQILHEIAFHGDVGIK